MALREHPGPVRAGRSGRHGRPGPFGGWLRLPTIRFSGAAVAMSTVVGISLATTWLLNEQQQVGRRIGVTVGGPPVPSPDASPTGSTAPAPGSTLQAAPATTGGANGGANGGATPVTSPHPAAVTASAPPVRAADAPVPGPSPAGTPVPGPSPSPAPSLSTLPAPSVASASSAPADPGPRPPSLGPSPSAAPSRTPAPSASAPLPLTLHGTGRADALGPVGTRHTLRLDLDEAMTALQVELRLNRPAALPGTTPATDLPGAVATIALERDTLVYRFTTPADLPLRPGSYTFTLTGAAADPTPAAAATPETWTASAFALPTARALTARGTF
ncbi:hypothetical protein [Kitasatospora fiedleri]|uniref:hypothetical protein n=1 Tax=Kitasatospora fiedleri TaxID=2991545 RepID=UPI00249B6C18|nr:hypothetical protein [Kitasatospora fiedleri]